MGTSGGEAGNGQGVREDKGVARWSVGFFVVVIVQVVLLVQHQVWPRGGRNDQLIGDVFLLAPLVAMLLSTVAFALVRRAMKPKPAYPPVVLLVSAGVVGAFMVMFLQAPGYGRYLVWNFTVWGHFAYYVGLCAGALGAMCPLYSWQVARRRR